MPSEFELIYRYFKRSTAQAVLGPGDDCALLQPSPGMQLVITTDMLISGTHFFPDTDPTQLGWKTLAVNLSDLAAMGATPRWILLAISLPEADEAWLAAFAKGLFLCAEQYQVDLVGGDTTRGPLSMCVTALGEAPLGAALCRHHAKVGDDIWVSGNPGMAGLGLAHLQGEIRLPDRLAVQCINALQQPLPRVELGTALLNDKLAHAAIDVSDGLLADLGHIAERSNVNATVFLSQLPDLLEGVSPEVARRCQLAGGDDYELVFTASANQRAALEALSGALQLPLWRIGRIDEAPTTESNMAGSKERVAVLDNFGKPYTLARKGFDHFD